MLVTFRIGQNHFALPVEHVKEITHMAEVSVPPGLPKFLEGFLNLEGGAVPVLRLSRLLKLPEQRLGLFTQLLILKNAESLLAILVDEVEAVVTVVGKELVALKEKSTFNDCAEAEVPFEDSVAHLLSLDKILLQEERELIQEFQAMTEERLQRLGEHNVE